MKRRVPRTKSWGTPLDSSSGVGVVVNSDVMSVRQIMSAMSSVDCRFRFSSYDNHAAKIHNIYIKIRNL